jgi:DNA-binding FadR family transcriptional regulator
MRDPGSARVTQKWHEDILDAIRAHDPDATRKLMNDHLLDFEKRIRSYLQTKEGDGRAATAVPPRSARVDRVPVARR